MSGFGLLQVCGRMRVPNPAMGMAIFSVLDIPLLVVILTG
jgi:hypothetical protein